MNEQACIGIFSAFYPPHLGGVEIYTRSIAHELTQMGYKVCIVTSQFDDSPNLEKDGALTIVRIPSVSLMNDRFPLIKPGPTTRRLIHYLMDKEMASVVINTRYYPLSHLGLRIAKRKGIRAVLLDHSSGPLDASQSVIGKAIRAYERVATNLVRKKAPASYGVSSKSAAWLEHLGLDACGVIPNAIDADAFRRAASPRNFKDELSLDDDALLIVFAGRLLEDKGVAELCTAVKEIARVRPQMHLAIAGSGPMDAQLSTLDDPHIHMLGRLSQADLAALLSQSSIVCLPSRYPEGLPTILLEAAVTNNALIVTDNGGTEEVVPTPAHGIVLEDGSTEQIRAALKRLYDDRNSATQMAACTKEHVEANLTWRRSAQALVKACQEHNLSSASNANVRC